MTFRITRNARINLPASLNPMTGTVDEVSCQENKGTSTFLTKTIGFLPFPSFAVLAGVTVFQPALSSIGLASGSFGYTALVLGSGLGLATSIIPFFRAGFVRGSKKLRNGGNSKAGRMQVEHIEPFAEWDRVFLPYAVESWNGVSVRDADGNSRRPVKMHMNSYIEFRTKSRTDNIDYSLIEAQRIE